MHKLPLWLLLIALFLSPAAPARATTLSLHPGWNLVSSRTAITVADTLNTANIISVWAWDTATTPSTWKVYLTGATDGGLQYASGKGFGQLATLALGEGFWVNAKSAGDLPVPGVEANQATMMLKPSWNLKGVTVASAINVAATFSDADTFTSVWTWTGTTWAVYLPGESPSGAFASSKGFQPLQTINSDAGFWVNVKAGSPAATATFATSTPPSLKGKVSEVVDRTDKSSYKPLAGVEVWVDGLSVGTTDSQGIFQSAAPGQNVTIATHRPGYVDTLETVAVPESRQLYLFVQKESPDTAALTAAGASQAAGKLTADKPTPKTMASSDQSSSLQIVNMQLTKDITVAVTTYNSYNTAPAPSAFAGLGLIAPEIIGGATVSIVDSLGNKTTNAEAGFSAVVTPKTNRILGKWTLEALADRINNQKSAELYLCTRSDSGWKKVGKATLPTLDGAKGQFLVPAAGINLSALADFAFVLGATGPAPEGTAISGTVRDAIGKQGIAGVYVSMDGVDATTISDLKGAFSLKVDLEQLQALNLPAVFLCTKKDGYYAANLPIATSGKSPLTDLQVEVKPFAKEIQITGTVTNAQTSAAIANAKVTIKTPSVLTKIQTANGKIVTGKDDAATFSWKITGEDGTLLNTIAAQGKNILTVDDLGTLINAETDYAFFSLALTVTHTLGTATFVEYAGGSIHAFSSGTAGQEVLFDLIPDFASFSSLDAWTDANGSYTISGIDETLAPFLTASASALGYAPSAYTPLTIANGSSSSSFSLIAKPQVDPLVWDFESGAIGWTAATLAQATSEPSQIGWTLLEHPETMALSPLLQDTVVQPDSSWLDLTGHIAGPLTMDESKSNSSTTVASATVVYQENGQTKTVPVLLYDNYDGLTDTPPDGFYDWVEPAPGAAADAIALWYDTATNPNQSPDPFHSYHLVEGSSVMVSVKGIATPTLLPAFSPNTVFWVGNSQPGANAGTYYDPTLPVASADPVTIHDATLESPAMDLTAFSQATLQFQGWFEVNASTAHYSSLTLEAAVVDAGLADTATITLETAWGKTTVNKGEYQLLAQYNPNSGLFSGTSSPGSAGWPLTAAGEHTPPQWTPYEINLSAYAGHTIKLRYTFSYTNSANNLYRGWAIDDVLITGKESAKEFTLLNADFGYFEPVTYQPATPGGGDYTWIISNGTITSGAMWEEKPWNPAPIAITITKWEAYDFSNIAWFDATLTFDGVPCIITNGLYNMDTKQTSYTFEDTATPDFSSGLGGAAPFGTYFNAGLYDGSGNMIKFYQGNYTWQ